MARSQMPPLSRAETEILTILWNAGRASVQEVCDRLPEHRRVAYATVQTLLRRLERKGYVGHDVEGKAHIFKPAVRREDVVRRSVTEFVDRLFAGDPVPLLLHLADTSGLDARDIARLRKMLDKDSE